MTKVQTLVLYGIVKYAIRHAMRVPRGAELVKTMEDYNCKFSVSRANAIIRALRDKGGIFRVKNKTLVIDEKHLVTEPETAKCVLKALELNFASQDARVTKDDLHGALLADGAEEGNFERMYKALAAAGYFVEQSYLGFFRPSDRAGEHEPYLKMIAEEK